MRARGFARFCAVLLGLRQLLVPDQPLFPFPCVPRLVVQLRARRCSMIERLPGGPAVSASSHLIRTVMFQEQVDMALHGGASQAMGIDLVALSRRPLPTRAYLLCLGPHRCRDQMVYQSNWLTYADLSSHRRPRLSGTFTCMVPSKSLTIRLASGVQIKGAITKFGFSPSTSMRGWLIAHPVKTNIDDQV